MDETKCLHAPCTCSVKQSDVYCSDECKSADIEAGAGRSAADLAADVQATAIAFAAEAASLPDEAWAAQVEMLRKMGGSRRTAVAFRLTALAREASRCGIRQRHPDYTEGDVRRAFFRLMHGDVLTSRVWPGAPLIEP